MDRKELIKSIKRSMRFRIIILLGIMLTFNTLAWFIYSSSISNSITTSVKAWQIEFEQNDESFQFIYFDIDDLYPGMPDYNNTINIVNYGETQATVEYEIIEMRLLDNTYTNTTYTSAQMESMLKNDYPFEISLSVTPAIIPPETGSADFEVNVNWPFENNNDALDTQWGHDSYSYKQANPTLNQITITIKLTAKQLNP